MLHLHLRKWRADQFSSQMENLIFCFEFRFVNIVSPLQVLHCYQTLTQYLMQEIVNF